MVWSIEVGLVSRNASDWIDSRYRLYQRGESPRSRCAVRWCSFTTAFVRIELRHAAQEYFRTHIEAQIFPRMQQLVAKLRSLGTEIWAVSSTNNWVIEEGVSRFEIPASRVLAACVQVLMA